MGFNFLNSANNVITLIFEIAIIIFAIGYYSKQKTTDGLIIIIGIGIKLLFRPINIIITPLLYRGVNNFSINIPLGYLLGVLQTIANLVFLTGIAMLLYKLMNSDKSNNLD